MRLTGIKQTTVGGKTYYYRRTPAGLVKLPDRCDPGFLAAYETAAKVAKPTKIEPRAPDTVAALCELYQSSDEWRDLKASTRIDRRRILAKIEQDRGTVMVKVIEPKHLYADMKGRGPAAANTRLKVWRSLFKLAIRDGWVTTNPTLVVEKRKEAAEAHPPWEPDDVAAYRAHWVIGTPQRLAFELFYWSGARCIDARILGRQMVDKKGWLCYLQEKTGGKVDIPMFCPLPGWCASFEDDRQMLLAALEGHADMTFIITAWGKPRTQKGISQWMSENATLAGLPHLTAHGLRASRAIELYMIDASTKKIAAWTGHLSLQEVEHYTRAASRRRLLAQG